MIFNRRFISLFLVFAQLFQLFFPVVSFAAEGNEAKKKPKYEYFSRVDDRLLRNFQEKVPENLTPDDVQEIIDSSHTETFNGNPTLRAEQSTILRPIKQIGLRVLDGEIGIIQTFIGFEGANFLKKAILSPAKSPKAIQALTTARKVVGKMSPKQMKGLNKALQNMKVGGKLSQAISKTAPGLTKFAKTEANFLIMTVIGTFVSMGIYDGLDVNTMKDKILALDPLQYNQTVAQSFLPNFMGAMSSRYIYAAFNNQFDKVYTKLLNSKNFAGYLFKKLDMKADILGRKIFKATRMGINLKQGESLAAKLGLVGVGEGAQFTLKGFLKSVSAGLAYGLVAQLAVDSVIVGARGYQDTAVIGGNRNSKSLRPEYNGFAYQRSESKIKNWMNERKYALLDLWDGWRKTPITKVVSSVTGFTGAYLGSVVAGAVLVGGGLPAMVGGVMIASLFGGIGSFLGSWATLKFERSETMKGVRRGFVERRLYKAILKMDVHARGEIDEENAKAIAKDRSKDFAKRESLGQTYNRMFLVSDFKSIELYKNDEYVYMKIAENLGEEFDLQAHIRYDLVDLDGYRGQWDVVTNKIYSVGRIADNNAYTVIFLTDNDKVTLSGDRLESVRGGEFRVLSNGLIMTKSDFDTKKWVIRGQNVNTDVFTRNSNVRYAWNEKEKIYIATTAVETSAQGLNDLKSLLSAKDFKKAILHKIQSMAAAQNQGAMAKVENLQSGEELDFFLELEQNGVDRAVIDTFIESDLASFKTIALGKIKRSGERKFQAYYHSLQKISEGDLKNALERELQDSGNETVFDGLYGFLDAKKLLVQVLK